MQLPTILLLSYAATGALMVFLTVAFYLMPTRAHRIHSGPQQKPGDRRRFTLILQNLGLSVGLMTVFSYLASPFLLGEEPASLGRASLDTLAILAIYDFAYYLMHRFPFHGWALLRKVHTVHHSVKHTSSVDSLYLHPVELALGIALLVAAGLIWGPVSVGTWGIIVTVYSALNIVIHSGLDLPWRGWMPINFLARKHAIHHQGMQRGNYASISPVFDILFGTSE